MREIKFRAFRQFPKAKMYYFSLGDLIFNTFNKQPLLDYAGVRDSIEQFTGLCDKNGREIYEGDIIRDSTFKERGSYVMRVEWEPEAASFVLTRKGWAFRHYFMESSDPKDCEVIGNIHENPELLE